MTMHPKLEIAALEAEIERLQVLSDRYGLALMMIREGGDDPRGIARRALEPKP